MSAQNFAAARRQRFEDERPSALACWGTGVAGVSFLLFILWLAGLTFRMGQPAPGRLAAPRHCVPFSLLGLGAS